MATIRVDAVRTTTRRRRAVVGLVGALLAAGGTACAPLEPPSLGEIKRTEFGRQAQLESARIAAGSAQPVLEFTVEDSPPSIFVNYIVPDAQAAAFTTAVDLPPGFTLAKVQILESDPEPRFWLSLNVYRVSGLTTGLRAEWSTYVDDGSGTPRFMIIRARASEGSVDPIGPLAPAEPFVHTMDAGGLVHTSMNRTAQYGPDTVVTGDNLFTSSITLPAVADRQAVQPTRQWVTANDFIYWRNGVNDRIFHNSTSHTPPLISVDLADVTLDDDTEWAPFVDPVPGHVLVYLDKLEFMIGPWWNVTEPDGRVDPATRASLLDLKKTMYGGLTSLRALSILTGSAEPIVQTRVEDVEPSVHWHWRIPDDRLADFEAAASPPAGLELAPLRLHDDDVDAAYWLSLNVYRASGATSGLRAEWSTYVADDDGVRSLILEARSDAPALDPVDRFTDPYPVTQTRVGGSLVTTVGVGATAFSSSIVLPPVGTGTTVEASRQWVGSSDLRYWSNGVADRTYYDSTVFDPKLSIDPATVPVADGGRWAAFTGTAPDRVWVDRQGTDIVVNPWWNVRNP